MKIKELKSLTSLHLTEGSVSRTLSSELDALKTSEAEVQKPTIKCRLGIAFSNTFKALKFVGSSKCNKRRDRFALVQWIKLILNILQSTVKHSDLEK